MKSIFALLRTHCNRHQACKNLFRGNSDAKKGLMASKASASLDKEISLHTYIIIHLRLHQRTIKRMNLKSSGASYTPVIPAIVTKLEFKIVIYETFLATFSFLRHNITPKEKVSEFMKLFCLLSADIIKYSKSFPRCNICKGYFT